MRAALLVTILLVRSAAADPFAVLRDTQQRWEYEVVHGDTLATLRPVKDAPSATCKVSSTPHEDIERVALICTTGAVPTTPGHQSFGGMLGLALYQTRDLVLDATGVRQVFLGESSAARLRDRMNALGFTFPRKLTAWTFDRTMHGMRLRVRVKSTTMKLGGKAQKIWVSESSLADLQAKGDAPLSELVAFAPGLGPALLCVEDRDKDKRDARWWCLRLRPSKSGAATK